MARSGQTSGVIGPSFFHIGVQLSFLLAQALCFPDSVLRAFSRLFNLS